jgi:gas vesicle protein
MGQDPSVIRAEIEETRARVGNEVDALSYKTDVGARASDFVEEKKEAVKSKVVGAKDAVVGTATKPIPSKQQLSRVRDMGERNPLGLAIGGAAVGFVAAMLLPATRVENEHLGEVSDRVVETAKETASDALERGKQVAQEAKDAAVETAKESGKEQTSELTSTLQERAQGQSGGGTASSDWTSETDPAGAGGSPPAA